MLISDYLNNANDDRLMDSPILNYSLEITTLLCDKPKTK